MAIAITNVNPSTPTNGNDLSSYTWSLSGLTTSTWLVVDFYSYQGSGYPSDSWVPTGGGLTFTKESTVASGSVYRFTRYYAWNPDQVAFTLTTNVGSTQLAAACAANQIAGASTSDPFVGVSYTNSGTGTSGTVTMSAYSDAGNRFLCAYNTNTWTGGAITEEHTQLCDFYIGSGGGGRISEQWHVTTQDTSPTASWTDSVGWRVISSEIAIASAPPATTVLDPMGQMGFFGA